MAARAKHEEHTNHERWVISYADMITLLFALFVVLYALGLDRLDEVAQSVAFAFHFEGEGMTKQLGNYEKGAGGGLIDAIDMLNAQDGVLKQMLLETLPDEFSEISGRSLEIDLSDDKVSFTGPLAAFFPTGRRWLEPKVAHWLGKLVDTTRRVTSRVQVKITAPDLVIGRNENGTARRSHTLCLERLEHMLVYFAYQQKEISKEAVRVDFEFMRDLYPPATRDDWEQRAKITLAFTR
jgi:hypothetical protein